MSILIYAKLATGSGNATSAERIASFFEGEEVLLRDIPPDIPDKSTATTEEILALRHLASEHGIRLAIGIHCYRAGSVLHQAFPERGGIPVILVASGTDLNVDVQKNSVNSAIRDAIAHSAGLISLSPDLLSKSAQLLATLPARQRPPLTLIPQAPSIHTTSQYSLRTALALKPEQALILLPAGLRPVKGVAFAIEAMAQALLEHPEHVFVIVGNALDPDYHAHCASLVVEWRLRHRTLKNRLLLIDGLPRADYLSALKEADLLLNTSESEAVSNALLEALGAGVPVLARDIPGNRAVLADEKTGLLFDRLTDFLRQYRRVFSDHTLRDRLIENGNALYRRECDVARERTQYLKLVDIALHHSRTVIHLPSGTQATLFPSPHTHPTHPANLALFGQIPLPVTERHAIRRVLDMGCGSGALGWLMADRLAQAGHPLDTMTFADNDVGSVDGLQFALNTANMWWQTSCKTVEVLTGDLWAALPSPSRPYDLILANLPQTPAPRPISPDRFGGEGEDGGASVLIRFIQALPAYLAPGGCAFCLHIGLAHPMRVAEAIAQAGLQSVVIASETRRLLASEYEALQPGLAEHLLALARVGKCDLQSEDSPVGLRLVFPARLIQLKRLADC